MKAIVKRRGRGDYLAIFRISGRNPIGFTIEGAGNNWRTYNHNGTELSNWTTKASQIEYLESKSEERLLELWNK